MPASRMRSSLARRSSGASIGAILEGRAGGAKYGAPRGARGGRRSALRARRRNGGVGGGALDTLLRRVDHDSLRRPGIPAMSSTLTIDGPCRRTLAFSIERSAVEAMIEERVAALA